MQTRPITPYLSTLALLASLGCSSSGLSTSSTPTEHPLPPETTTFDVTWKPSTVILDEANVKPNLVSADYANGVLTFSGSATSIAALKADDVVVLGGVGLYKIVSVVTTNGQLVVTTATAALTDAISDGNIAWSQNITESQTTKMQGIGVAQATQALSGSYSDGAISFSDNIQGFDTTFSLTPSGDGFSLSTTAKYKGDSGEIVNLAGTGTIRGFTNTGSIQIAGSSIKNFSLLISNLEGDLTLEAGGVSIGGSVALSIPAKIAIPFALGPIPVFTSVGGAIEITSTLSAQSTAKIKGHYAFSGSTGIAMEGGIPTTIGQLDGSNITYESGDQVSTIDAGFDALLDFPRVEFGFGVPGTGGTSYFDIKTEAITNMEMTYEAAGNFPVITGSCITANVNLGGYVGGSFSVFNFTLAKSEMQVFGLKSEPHKTGSKCK